MNMKVLVLILLGVLVLMSFVQGIQINNLEEVLEEGVSIATSQTSPSSINTNTRTANVPTMVGGC